MRREENEQTRFQFKVCLEYTRRATVDLCEGTPLAAICAVTQNICLIPFQFGLGTYIED